MTGFSLLFDIINKTDDDDEPAEKRLWLLHASRDSVLPRSHLEKGAHTRTIVFTFYYLRKNNNKRRSVRQGKMNRVLEITSRMRIGQYILYPSFTT